MKQMRCPYCRRQTGFKRHLGWGTFFAILLTGGFWLIAIHSILSGAFYAGMICTLDHVRDLPY